MCNDLVTRTAVFIMLSRIQEAEKQKGYTSSSEEILDQLREAIYDLPEAFSDHRIRKHLQYELQKVNSRKPQDRMAYVLSSVYEELLDILDCSWKLEGGRPLDVEGY